MQCCNAEDVYLPANCSGVAWSTQWDSLSIFKGSLEKDLHPIRWWERCVSVAKAILFSCNDLMLSWSDTVLTFRLISFINKLKSGIIFDFQWCGLRTRPVWDQKMVLVLVLQVWCCVMKHGLVTLVVVMILNDTATFQAQFIISVFCAWNITTVINRGVHLLTRFAKCLSSLPVVLVLVV